MIYISLNVLFNAFVLFFVFVVGVAFSGHKNIHDWMLWDSAFVLSAVLTVIGYTRVATFAIGFFIPGRKMVGREKSRIEPLLSTVIEDTNKKYGTTYQLNDLKIKVSDEKIANAFALGYNTIVVNRGAFDSFNDGQLRAILGHEMGHLIYRDSVRSIALIFSSFATRIVMWLYSLYVVIASASAFAKDAKGEAGVISLFSWIPVLMFLPVLVLNGIGSKVFNLLNLAMSRGAEYRADAFAASLGYKDDMIKALEIMDNTSVTDNSFIAKLIATHPAPMQRIGALEDEGVAKKKIGSLLILTPSNANDNLGGASEIMRLVVILAIAGVLWGSVMIKNMLRHSKQAAEIAHTLQQINPIKK